MRIEAGKAYEVRDPDYVKKKGFKAIVNIVRENQVGRWCMISSDSHAYLIGGGIMANKQTPFDLVREVAQS